MNITDKRFHAVLKNNKPVVEAYIQQELNNSYKKLVARDDERERGKAQYLQYLQNILATDGL